MPNAHDTGCRKANKDEGKPHLYPIHQDEVALRAEAPVSTASPEPIECWERVERPVRDISIEKCASGAGTVPDWIARVVKAYAE